MNPDVELRIRTLMRAMNEVVIPGIDPDNALAREQAGLVLGHLNALLQHVDKEATLRERNDAANRALAGALLDAGSGGDATRRAATALRAARSKGDAQALTHALEQFVIAVGIDGEPALHEASSRLVMAHAKAQNHAGRAWFKPMGFDAAPDDLPDPADLFEEPEP